MNSSPSHVHKAIILNIIVTNWWNMSEFGVSSKCKFAIYTKLLNCGGKQKTRRWHSYSYSCFEIILVSYLTCSRLPVCIIFPGLCLSGVKLRSTEILVRYICGFHRAAQHQRLQTCVKSLFDGRRQPQWLSVILQKVIKWQQTKQCTNNV